MPYKVLPIPRLFFTKCIIYNENVILTRVYSISSISSSKKHDRRYVTTNDKLKDWATIPSPTPFDIFALPKTASDEEIKSRYYELVKIYHPDKNCDKSPERFRKIVKAYEILNNKHKKEMYLRFGVGWDSPTVITAATSSNGEFSKTERFMSNPYFAAFVITATLFGVAIQYMRLESSMGWIRAAEERHHLKAAHYLASAKRESQLFGKRKKAEMMLDLLHTNGVKDQNVCNSASILNSLIE
ncbi:DnaJ-domain-containing protein [Rhizophagus irregularis]|uniref:DnaJ-domain-containing protein n=1 Tax=Rhizophagus irregularis TaxID=588596 RepID=A0A2N0PSI9_9GLOM|nr:DnaJ-domain-containing protein [Rhizophagus irregularis]